MSCTRYLSVTSRGVAVIKRWNRRVQLASAPKLSLWREDSTSNTKITLVLFWMNCFSQVHTRKVLIIKALISKATSQQVVLGLDVLFHEYVNDKFC